MKTTFALLLLTFVNAEGVLGNAAHQTIALPTRDDPNILEDLVRSVNALTAKVEVLERADADLKGEIEDLKTENAQRALREAALRERVDGLKEETDDMKTDIDNIQQDISDVNNELKAIDDIETDIKDLQTLVKSQGLMIDTTKDDVNDLQQQDKNIADELAALTVALKKVAFSVSKHQKHLDEIETDLLRLDKIDDKIEAMQKQIVSQENHIFDIKGDVSALQNGQRGLALDVEELQATEKKLQELLAAIEKAIEEFGPEGLEITHPSLRTGKSALNRA